MLPITIEEGSITVEAISGLVTEEHFVLYVTLAEKNANAVCGCENPAIVTLWGENEAGAGAGTRIVLPSGWCVEASASGYVCRIIGVRSPGQVGPVPFTTDPMTGD